MVELTILTELHAEIQEVLRNSAAKTLLWLDQQREWERLLDKLPSDFDILKYNGSQLEMRAIVERRAVGRPRIVYVPLPPQRLTVLKEYEFTLPVWDESLLHALRRWGVEIEREEEKVLLPLLPSLAARWSEKPMDYWRRLTATGVRAGLFDEEQVRVFLADPEGVSAELEHEGTLAIFHDFLEEAFGVASNSGMPPVEVARRLVQNLMLSEAATFGSPESFPHQDRLPQPAARERGVRFLKRWLEARSQAGTASRLLREAEPDLQLGSWAKSLREMPDVESGLQLERTLAGSIVSQFCGRPSLDERAALLTELLPVFRRHATHFWALEGEVTEWEALGLAGEVANGAQEALAEIPDLRTAAEFVQAYANRWWKVDQAYRRYRAGFEGHAGLDEVAETTRRLHRRYLEETNKRFAEALEASPGLEATTLPPQRYFWPSGNGSRRAVLILDAFRFDLARELEARLRGSGGQTAVQLQPMRAPLPSITPLGMASLLPVDGIKVAVSDGIWSIRPASETGGAPDLAAKEGREKLLASMFPGSASVELGRLLDLPIREIPRVPWLFVYSSTLDDAGHGGVLALTPRASEDYVEQCARAVRKLASAGIEQVHVVTDHGFFLLDEVTDRDLIPVTAKDLQYKSHRAVVGRDIASPSLLTFPLVGSDLTVGVPRATGILQARGGYQFFHGGASLQEIVVPHLSVVFPRRTVKFGVRLHTPARITSLYFDVEVEAVPPGGQHSFAGQVAARYVEVRAYLIREGQVIKPPLATAAGPYNLVSESQRKKTIRLRVGDASRFRYGDTVRVSVYDADAPDIELDKAEATLNVEGEF